MKIDKIVAVAALAIAAGQSFTVQAATASACAGVAGSQQPFGNVGATRSDTNSFVKVGFSIQCSNNVLMNYDDISATVFSVGAGSAKGNAAFAGNSNGGAIRQLATCPSTGCTASEVNTAITAAGSS